MLRRLIVLALVALATVLPVGSASAAPYTPKIPTQTIIKIVVHADHSVTAVVRVLANTGKGHPHGTVNVKIASFTPTARGAQAVAAAPWQTSAHYDGGRLTLDGPTLSQGTYVANASFAPSGDRYRPSRDTQRFHIGATPTDHDSGDNDNGGGLLPDTGGPFLFWLLLGAGLVGAGGGAVVYSRRRRAAQAALTA